MGWVMVAMIIMVCAMKKKFFCSFVIKQGRGLVALLDHEWICHTKANGMATMVCITRKKKWNFATSSCNLVRTLVALQDDARPWLCFHDHNGGC